MNRSLLLIAALGTTFAATAQVQVNPQVGLTMHKLTGTEPQGVSNRASVGFLVGLDVRIGETFYLQPGAFFSRTATAYTIETASPDPNNPGTLVTTEIEDNLVRSNLKLRAMLGYKIVNEDAFKLRLAIGPSYDVLMSVDNTDDNIQWNEGDFSSGSFNIDGTLGFDFGILTIEPGVSIGLTDVYDTDEQAFEKFDSKNLTFFLTAGLVFGSGSK